MLVLLTSGQTGVERGVYLAARVCNVKIAGFMPTNRRDELGSLPAELHGLLTPCEEKGPRPAQLATIRTASGVVLVVPDRAHPEKFPAMRRLIQGANNAGIPLCLCDPTNLDEARGFVSNLRSTSSSPRIYITGPRATRWGDGQTVAKRVVFSLVLASAAAEDAMFIR